MKSMILKTATALVVIVLVANACKKSDDSVDCTKVTGATFSTNSGKIASILENKCGNSGCHAVGGTGEAHWKWDANYDVVKQHFGHMIESVEDGTMPEAGSPKLTAEEIDQLACWKSAGYPK